MDNKVIVTGCGECPFFVDYYEGSMLCCANPNYEVGFDEKKLFAECPLKQSSLTIELSNDAKGVDRQA